MSDIIKIKKTDIISDSVDVINQNFDIIQGIIESDNYVKSLQLGDIETRLNNLENKNNQNFSDLVKDLNDLTEKIEDEFDENNIQDMINKSLTKSASDLEDFIKRTAGQQVYKALGPYATTSTIDGKIEQKLQGYLKQGDLDEYDNYVKNELLAQYNKSSAFTQYQSDADRKYAEVSTIVANSKFYFEKNSNGVDCLYSVTEPVGITNYTSIEDFYDKGKVTLDSNGKVVGLGSKPVKEVVDPTNAGLTDLTVLKNLIQICEKLFKTISTEMVTLRQSVGDGKAEFDIIAAIKGPDGQDIAASIFAYADKEGSRLILSGDNINLNADKKLKLKSGTFELDSKEMSLNSDGKLTINSENLKLNDDELMMKGNIYATNQNNQITAGIIGARKNTNGNNRVVRFFAGTESTKEGDEYKLLEEDIENAKFKVYDDGHVVAKDIELVFNGNHTSIDEDGILHANGAEISGNIQANEFFSTNTFSTTVEKENKNYTGDITYEATINNNLFKISADGVLKCEDDDSKIEIKGKENYLAFKILPQLSNENPDITEDGNTAQYLYGVPTLTMYYKGKPFYLNPTCWMSASNAGVNTSNMRWIKQYDVYTCNFLVSSKTTSTGQMDSGKIGYTIFSTSNSSFFVKKIEDEICRMTVLSYSDNESDELGYLQNANLLINENEGVFIRKSDLGNPPKYYGTESGSNTNITPNTCAIFENYLPKSEYATYVHCKLESEIEDHNNKSISGIGKEYGRRNICQFIQEKARQSIPPSEEFTTSGYWKKGGEYVEIEGIDNIIPFGENNSNRINAANQYFNMEVDYYPKITISSSGKNVSSTTKKIYGKCHCSISADDYDYKINYVSYKKYRKNENDDLYTLETMGTTFVPDSVEFVLDFEFILDLSVDIRFNHLKENKFMNGAYDPDELDPDVGDNRIILESVIEKYLDDINWSTIVPNSVNLTCTINSNDLKLTKNGFIE